MLTNTIVEICSTRLTTGHMWNQKQKQSGKSHPWGESRRNCSRNFIRKSRGIKINSSLAHLPTRKYKHTDHYLSRGILEQFCYQSWNGTGKIRTVKSRGNTWSWWMAPSADVISLPLSIIFQKSLNAGIVPSQWLKACITAIHKKGSKINPENYRPISITSVVFKIMESIVRDKLISHMELNDLFSNKQHGFVPHWNCMTNLLTCMELRTLRKLLTEYLIDAYCKSWWT